MIILICGGVKYNCCWLAVLIDVEERTPVDEWRKYNFVYKIKELCVLYR